MNALVGIIAAAVVIFGILKLVDLIGEASAKSVKEQWRPGPVPAPQQQQPRPQTEPQPQHKPDTQRPQQKPQVQQPQSKPKMPRKAFEQIRQIDNQKGENKS